MQSNQATQTAMQAAMLESQSQVDMMGVLNMKYSLEIGFWYLETVYPTIHWDTFFLNCIHQNKSQVSHRERFELNLKLILFCFVYGFWWQILVTRNLDDKSNTFRNQAYFDDSKHEKFQNFNFNVGAYVHYGEHFCGDSLRAPFWSFYEW